jgi:hypothetical protein
MNMRFFIAWAVVFALWMAGSFVIHGVLLHRGYASLPQLFRPPADAQPYFPLMILAHIIMAGAFTWIYARGVEAKPWLGQGLRYGAAVALLTVVPWYLIYYVVQPMPAALAGRQIVFSAILVLVLGVVVASLCRSEKRVRA